MNPGLFFLVAGPMRSLDPTLEEAASVSGAGYWRTFWRIDVPLIWPLHERVEEQLKKLRLDTLIARERIACIPVQAYAPYVELLRNATCVLTDSWNLQEEACALGIPCLMMGLHPQRMQTPAISSTAVVGNSKVLATRAVWDCLFNGGKRGQIPALWDGRAAERIAAHLAEWLPQLKSSVHESH
jgi:UDP-N-acetylglucosamine 2-epimerase (non-hydrolysing)